MPFFCVRQDYEELEKQLKEVFKERSTVLRQLTKTSRELDGIKVNLQVSWKLILSAAKKSSHPLDGYAFLNNISGLYHSS